MTVIVRFNYEPNDPDDDDPTGLSADEFDEITAKIMEIGGDNIEIKKK